jgi:spore coat protein U-like protein
MRFVLAACCGLLPLSAESQRARPPEACPVRPAECQINAQVFDFGRAQMTTTSPPINGFGTISVTCTRSLQAERDGREVRVTYLLKAVPAAPARQMRDNELHFLRYDMFVDPARTRYWGDGYASGTFALEGTLILNDRNRVGTLVHQLYGKVDGGQSGFPGQWLGLVGAALQFTPVCAG